MLRARGAARARNSSTRSITSARRAGGRKISTARSTALQAAVRCSPRMPKRATTSGYLQAAGPARRRDRAVDQRRRRRARDTGGAAATRCRAARGRSVPTRAIDSLRKSGRARPVVRRGAEQSWPRTDAERHRRGVDRDIQGADRARAARRHGAHQPWNGADAARRSRGGSRSAARGLRAAAGNCRGALQPRAGTEAAGRVSRPPRRSCAARTSSTRRCPKRPTRSASSCGRRDEADDAERAFRQAIARRPDYADAHYMLATILRQRGRSTTRSPSCARR